MGKLKCEEITLNENSDPNLQKYQQNQHNNQFSSYSLYAESRIYLFRQTHNKKKNKPQNLLVSGSNNKTDTITIYRVLISRQKLNQMNTEAEIYSYGEMLNQLLQKKDSYHFFNYFPNQLLHSVIEFTGCHFSPRRMMLNSSLKQISQINFCNLVELHLADQLLFSVEALTFLNSPKLMKLSIKRNKITNLNTLVKADFPNLEELQFYLNPINKMQNFFRFHPKSFKFLICYNQQQSLNLINENKLSFTSQYEGQKYAVMHNKIERYYGSDYKFLKQFVW